MIEKEPQAENPRLSRLAYNRQRFSNLPHNLAQGERRELAMATQLLSLYPPESDLYKEAADKVGQLERESAAIARANQFISQQEAKEYSEAMNDASLNPDQADIERLEELEKKMFEAYQSLKQEGLSDSDMGALGGFTLPEQK